MLLLYTSPVTEARALIRKVPIVVLKELKKKKNQNQGGRYQLSLGIQG